MTTAQHLAEAATATCRHKADINEDREARSGEHKAHVHGQRSEVRGQVYRGQTTCKCPGLETS